ncbi:hypothetical protein [Heliothis virescens ascovirus 3g]|uniref:Uncharacterized protein n=1 Tax=Heliothis virescens ascovirus 3g TaxID=1246651 RepID=K4NYG8_9VIRU|nr:hypothetical protein F8204_gp188 [Heliothis virescens ascovirus 3g]AFV50440.1 hypothetical protein [Heliothis virescens ascovirus 3g]
MPRIRASPRMGKHCHNCGYFMKRRALQKNSNCNDCKEQIYARRPQIASEALLVTRCVECDALMLNIFNFCEICGYKCASCEPKDLNNRKEEHNVGEEQNVAGVSQADDCEIANGQKNDGFASDDDIFNSTDAKVEIETLLKQINS